MLISIVIPMYNSSRYLDDLFSILNTAVSRNIEIILVDDGSEDDTFEKCNHYKKSRSNVCLICNSNHGVSYSRNCGIESASGEYLMFVDSDDKLLLEWNSTLIHALDSVKDADIIFFSDKVKNAHPIKKDIICSIMGVGEKNELEYLGSPCSKLYKRNFLLQNKIKFNERVVHGEDALFNMEAFLKTDQYYFVRKSIYSYYINCNSATHKYDEKFLGSNQYYLQMALEQLRQSPLFENDEITHLIDYSFTNSVYIYAGKVSKLKVRKEKVKAINDFYTDEFYCKNIRKIKAPKELSIAKHIVYNLVKFKLFYLLEWMLPLIPRRRVSDKGYWIDI